jgi:hypothetical protein
MLIVPIVNAIMKSFCDGSEVDMSMTCEGDLNDIGDQPGKGANWIWAYKERERARGTDAQK